MQPRALIAVITTTVIGGFAVAAPAAMAGKPGGKTSTSTCHKSCPAPSPSPTPTQPPADTTAPAVAFASPAAGSTLAGTTNIAGSSSDNVSVSRVDVRVDAGSWQAVAGTSSWTFSWDTTTVADGSHDLTVRATDSSGNTSTASRSFTVTNSTGSTGGGSTGGGSTGGGSTGGGSTSAPNTQGSWVSPEGVHINVNSSGSWTIAQVYSMLTANARDLDVLGPLYTINLQDSQSSMTTVGYQVTNGVPSNFHATTWLKGVSSTFANWPDYIFAHEFGEAWTQYYYAMKHGGSWASWEQMRYDQSTYNGTTYPYLIDDPRLGGSQTWDPREMIADDYRLLFGSSAAISERNASINTVITDPRNQPGLANWLLQQWAQ